MKNLIFVLIMIVLIINCKKSVNGPGDSFDTPNINYPKDNIYIEADVGDTIYADWTIVEGCTKIYRAIIYNDSSEVAKPDSISWFATEIGISPKMNIIAPQQTIFIIDSSKAMLVIQDFDFRNLGDTIKIYWKIMAQSDEEDRLYFDKNSNDIYSPWSDIESFYVINANL